MNQRLQVGTRRYWKECRSAGAGLYGVAAGGERLCLLIDLAADGGKVRPQQRQQSKIQPPRPRTARTLLGKVTLISARFNYLTACSRDI